MPSFPQGEETENFLLRFECVLHMASGSQLVPFLLGKLSRPIPQFSCYTVQPDQGGKYVSEDGDLFVTGHINNWLVVLSSPRSLVLQFAHSIPWAGQLMQDIMLVANGQRCHQ